jgi:hypothetical protein
LTIIFCAIDGDGGRSTVAPSKGLGISKEEKLMGDKAK